MRVCPACNTRTESEKCPKDGQPTLDERKLPASHAKDPLIGETLGEKYTLEKLLGRGAFAAVYLARHAETGGKVAIKLLRIDLLKDSDAIHRFYIEAKNTHKLHHHNTIRLSDFGETGTGLLYLVMEYVRGRTLSDVLQTEGRLPAGRVIPIIEQILKSLGEAHELGVVHRDMKPENIMLVDQFGDPDFVKVLDFGISRSRDGSGANTQGVVGTPKYMAPEQWRGRGVDARTDLYAVGSMMYEMLSGRPVFVVEARGAEWMFAYMNAHLEQEPTPLLEAAPGCCSRALADLVMELLSKDPSGRPADANAVLKRIVQIRTGMPHPRPVPPVEAPVAPTNTGDRPGAVHDSASHSAESIELSQTALVSEAPTHVAEVAEPRDSHEFGLPPPGRPRPAGRNRRWTWAVIGVAIVSAAVWVAVLVPDPSGEPDRLPKTTALSTAIAADSKSEKRSSKRVETRPKKEMPVALATEPRPERVAPAPARAPAPAPAPAPVPAPHEAPANTKPVMATPETTSRRSGTTARNQAGDVLGQAPSKLPQPTAEDGPVFIEAAACRNPTSVLKSPPAGHTAGHAADHAADHAVQGARQLARVPVLRLSSTPSGATVAIKGSGTIIGQTPLSWPVPKDIVARIDGGQSVTLVFKKAGRRARNVPLTPGRLASDEPALGVRLRKTRPKRRPSRPETTGKKSDEPKPSRSKFRY